MQRALSRAKLQSNQHHQQTNIQFFTGRMPFLSPNQQYPSTEGKNITFHGLAYPKLTWGPPTLSLTTNSSWLHWGRVAMPLVSPLMPVPQNNQQELTFINQTNELFLTMQLTESNIQTQQIVNQRSSSALSGLLERRYCDVLNQT